MISTLGIATDLRSRPPEEVGAEIARLWPLIAAQDPQIVHLKICSTFDSSPRIGSIGAMVAALRQHFQPEVTAIIGGQPSLGRYLAFGHLFARGPDGEIHRIDRHPVMARHPVTPMREADMRLHLAAQGLQSLDLVTTDMLADPDAVAARLRAGAVIFDILRQQDLERVAEALRRAGRRQLLVGASSVAEMLTRAVIGRAAAETPVPQHGGVLIFASSRSPLTGVRCGGFPGWASDAGRAWTVSKLSLRGGAGQLRRATRCWCRRSAPGWYRRSARARSGPHPVAPSRAAP
ncbi:MAG: four-carbon acid sugar kinase family protein [Paracoccaceae bacterium]